MASRKSLTGLPFSSRLGARQRKSRARYGLRPAVVELTGRLRSGSGSCRLCLRGH
jgi:hypothetical protein